MPDFTVADSVVVAASPDAVFALITDPSRLTEWNREIVDVDAPPALTVGDVWTVGIKAMGMGWRSRSTVIALDPAAGLFTYRSGSDDGNPSTADWSWRLQRVDAGTEVQVEVKVSPKTFWRKHLLSRFRVGPLRKAMRESLVSLQRAFANPSPS